MSVRESLKLAAAGAIIMPVAFGAAAISRLIFGPPPQRECEAIRVTPSPLTWKQKRSRKAARKAAWVAATGRTLDELRIARGTGMDLLASTSGLRWTKWRKLRETLLRRHEEILAHLREPVVLP